MGKIISGFFFYFGIVSFALLILLVLFLLITRKKSNASQERADNNRKIQVNTPDDKIESGTSAKPADKEVNEKTLYNYPIVMLSELHAPEKKSSCSTEPSEEEKAWLFSIGKNFFAGQMSILQDETQDYDSDVYTGILRIFKYLMSQGSVSRYSFQYNDNTISQGFIKYMYDYYTEENCYDGGCCSGGEYSSYISVTRISAAEWLEASKEMTPQEPNANIHFRAKWRADYESLGSTDTPAFTDSRNRLYLYKPFGLNDCYIIADNTQRR